MMLQTSTLLWNPPTISRVQGALQEIDCKDGMRLVVETSAARITLTIADPKRVQMRNAPPEFVCGPQPGTPVIVEYAATAQAQGILRGVEFRELTKSSQTYDNSPDEVNHHAQSTFFLNLHVPEAKT
jgi:hypothetical protein